MTTSTKLESFLIFDEKVKNIRLFFYSKPVFWSFFVRGIYFTNATAKKSEFHILLILDGNLVVVLCGVLLLLPLFDNGLYCRPHAAATARTQFFPFDESVTKSRCNGTTLPLNSFCCVLQKIRVISSKTTLIFRLRLVDIFFTTRWQEDYVWNCSHFSSIAICDTESLININIEESRWHITNHNSSIYEEWQT